MYDSYSNIRNFSNDSKAVAQNKSYDKHISPEIKMKPMKLQFYRTKLCPWIIAAGHCRKELICHYAHSIEELRPLPNLTKTKMCKTFLATKQCPNITNCKFAHSPKELRATQSFNKTKLCPLWQENKCNAGYYCRFAHGYEELRLNEYVRDVYENRKTATTPSYGEEKYEEVSSCPVSTSNLSSVGTSSLLPSPSHILRNTNRLTVALTLQENNNVYSCTHQQSMPSHQIENAYTFEGGSVTPQNNPLSEGNESYSRFPSYLLPSGIFTPLTPQCVDYLASSQQIPEAFSSDAFLYPERSGSSPVTGGALVVDQDGRPLPPSNSVASNMKPSSSLYYNRSPDASHLTPSTTAGTANVMFSSFYPLTLRTVAKPKTQQSENNFNKYMIGSQQPAATINDLVIADSSYIYNNAYLDIPNENLTSKILINNDMNGGDSLENYNNFNEDSQNNMKLLINPVNPNNNVFCNNVILTPTMNNKRYMNTDTLSTSSSLSVTHNPQSPNLSSVNINDHHLQNITNDSVNHHFNRRNIQRNSTSAITSFQRTNEYNRELNDNNYFVKKKQSVGSFTQNRDRDFSNKVNSKWAISNSMNLLTSPII